MSIPAFPDHRQERHHRPQRDRARLHAEDGVLIGMGSIVMNGARIRRGSVVGAGSVITEGKEFPENFLIIGAPARVVRTLDAAQAEALSRPAKSYAIRGPQVVTEDCVSPRDVEEESA